MKDPTYRSWQSMRQRCAGTKGRNQSYKLNGILFDPRWNSFKNFLSDMGPRPLGTTLERENGEEDYTAVNCCWATKKQQARNRQGNLNYFYQGKERTVAEIADLYGIKKYLLYQRLSRGYTLEQALDKPIDKGYRLK